MSMCFYLVLPRRDVEEEAACKHGTGATAATRADHGVYRDMDAAP